VRRSALRGSSGRLLGLDDGIPLTLRRETIILNSDGHDVKIRLGGTFTTKMQDQLYEDGYMP
jgi:hypothetical protein